jgi:hypothetical protein
MLVALLPLVSPPVWPRTATPFGSEQPVWQPASAWDDGTGLFGAIDVPADYDPWVLALGRSVYADLQRARQAALRKESTNLSVALGEALDTIHRLRLPAGVMALDAQLQVIRKDLRDTGKHPDDTLWVPVAAEINKVLVYVPEAVGRRMGEALRGRTNAARPSDAQNAARQPDLVASSMQYSLGMFPLNKVRRDLAAASAAAADRPTPDWDGALHAVQDALTAFRWYTQAPAPGLLSAKNAVIHAYDLARGMYAHPELWWSVSRYLDRARQLLAETPSEWPLVDQTSKTIHTIELHKEDAVGSIGALLGALQAEIHRGRQRAG